MKKLLIGIAVVVVLLVAAALVAPFFIPVDTYKNQLVAEVKQATGRDLTIKGKVSFSILPSLAVEAHDVAFANPPGAAGPNMATLSALELRLKLLPLLGRRLVVDKLVLVDPVIALEIDKQGRPNWQFAAPAPATSAARPAAPAASPAPAAAGGGGALAGLSLNDMQLENGSISYLDRRGGQSWQLQQIAMTLSLPDLDSPLKAAGSAVYRGEKLALQIDLARPRALLDGTGSAVKLGLDSQPIAFGFNGTVAGSTPPKLDGAVELKIPSLRKLAQWAGSPLAAPGTGFGPLAISGKVSVAGSRIGFSDASLSLDRINGKGEVALDTAGARPALTGKLAVDKLDLNPYLAPPAQGGAAAPAGGAASGAAGAPAGGAPAAKQAGWSDQPIDLAPLKSADVDFALSAGSLIYRKIQIGSCALGLHLKNGRLEADLTELALYQGHGTGKVVVDGSGAVPGVQALFDLKQIQVQPLFRDALDIDRLSGTGVFDLAVAGRGRNEREIIGSLDGKGSLNLANGAIKGVNLVAMVRNIASAFQAGASTQETVFSSLAGTYTIANGILRNNDLQLKSADLPMSGAGTVDLPQRRVDYKITPRVAGAIAVPVIIKGPWDDLSYQPDLAGLVGGAGRLLQGGAEGAGQTLQSAPQGVGKLLKGLFGGSK